MKRRKLFLLLTAFILTNIVGVHAQSIIYDATSPNKVLAFTAEQQGDEVYAIGNARTVTQLQIGLSMQGFSGTSDFVLRLYANDGTAGAPGTTGALASVGDVVFRICQSIRPSWGLALTVLFLT